MVNALLTFYLIIGACLWWDTKEYRWTDRIVLAIGWLPLYVYLIIKEKR